MSKSCVQVILYNTEKEQDFSIESTCELLGSETSEFSDEIFYFLKGKLGKGIYNCIVLVDIEYTKINHPLDPVDYEAEATFKLLDYEVLETDDTKVVESLDVEEFIKKLTNNN